jgi:hypothetical protein
VEGWEIMLSPVVEVLPEIEDGQILVVLYTRLHDRPWIPNEDMM